MERIYCEVCNSDHLVKDGDYFVCESCGAKYKAEDLRKLILETVEVVPGEKTLTKLYEDAAFYMSIEKYADAFQVYKKITEEFPKEYKPWLQMMRIDIGHKCAEFENLHVFEKTYFYEAKIRGASNEEIKEIIVDVFNNIKATEPYMRDNIYLQRESFGHAVLGDTRLLTFKNNKDTNTIIFLPKDREIYNTTLNWFAMNLYVFVSTCHAIECHELADEIMEYYNYLDENGVFLCDFDDPSGSWQFDNRGFQEYDDFFYKYNKRVIHGKVLDTKLDIDYKAIYPDYDDAVEYIRELDARKMYVYLLDQYEFPKKEDADMFKYNPRVLHASLKFMWKGFFIMYSLFSSTWLCFYIKGDKEKMIEDFKIKYIEQRKEAKEKCECPWCGKFIDYSILPQTCSECKTIIEDVNYLK